MSDSVTRSCAATSATIEWKVPYVEWEDLSAGVRNRVRDLMDEAIDTINAAVTPVKP